MSMTDSAPVDNTKTDYLGEVSRQEYADYLTRFRPSEDKLINSIDNNQLMQGSLDEVSKNASTAGRVMTETANMRAGRTGGMSAEQRQALDERMQLGLATADVGGQNAVRTHVKDRDTENLSALVNTGTGVRSLANSSLSTAAQMESSRNATNASIASSNTAGRWGLAGTAAAAGIMLA
jgi:hypothetical protein